MEQLNTIPQAPPNGYYSDSSTDPQEPKEGWKSVLSTILIIIAAPAIAFMLTTFVFQSYEVDGESMETTLQHEDRLIVLKTGKTWARITNNDYLPNRGEIIVFEQNSAISDQQENGESRQLIKRVIGLPGERVVVKDGSITVFNDEFPLGFNPDKIGDYNDGVSETTPQNVDIVVPEGEVFVCGDNRPNSSDSRSFGTVPAKDIMGNLVLRIYPFSKFDRF